MATSVYVAAVEGFTGKSAVALGCSSSCPAGPNGWRSTGRWSARGRGAGLRPGPAVSHGSVTTGVRGVRRRDLRRAAPRPGRCAGHGSWNASTASRTRPTWCWWWAATTPTSVRRPSSRSTPDRGQPGRADAAGPQRPRPLDGGAAHRGRTGRRGAAGGPRHACSRSWPTASTSWPRRGLVDALDRAGCAGLRHSRGAAAERPLGRGPDGGLRGHPGQRRREPAGPGGDRRRWWRR